MAMMLIACLLWFCRHSRRRQRRPRPCSRTWTGSSELPKAWRERGHRSRIRTGVGRATQLRPAPGGVRIHAPTEDSAPRTGHAPS
jgi:hypothetical protein